MRIPGFNRPAAEDDPVFLERGPGESREAFEDRLAARRAARDLPPGEAPRAAPRDAYVEGRRDQRALERERRDAERDERRREARLREAEARSRRHGGLGLVGILVAVVAVIGVLWLVLAARQGSFAAGGAVVDQKIAEATQPAKNALDRTGQAVQNAGQAIQDQGERIRQAAR